MTMSAEYVQIIWFYNTRRHRERSISLKQNNILQVHEQVQVQVQVKVKVQVSSTSKSTSIPSQVKVQILFT
jgi:hypothetical protein